MKNSTTKATRPKVKRRWQIYVGEELFEDMREARFRLNLTYHDIVTDAVREWLAAHPKGARGKAA